MEKKYQEHVTHNICKYKTTENYILYLVVNDFKAAIVNKFK